MNNLEKKKYGPEGYKRLKEKSAQRGIPFAFHNWKDLTKWREKQIENCSYCNMTMKQYRKIRRRLLHYEGDNLFLNKAGNVVTNSSDYFFTIDRADPHYGYVPTNMRLCCQLCNQIKSCWLNKEQARVICPLVVQTLINELNDNAIQENII